jgi:PAS domain S-box-containing protein
VLLSDNHDADIHTDPPAAALPVGFDDRKVLGSLAFERTRMPMVVADARHTDMPIVLANKAFLDLTGYTADEVLGRNCRFLQGKDTSAAAVAEVRLAIAEGRDVDVELLNYRKDGSEFWNQLHLSPIRDDNGQVAYFFASQIDVTKYRRVQALEASEQRLLMEVDHRANNVLAVVDSIVRLTRPDNPARYAAAVQQRVQALSIAHSQLAEIGWRNPLLHDVLYRQIRRFKANGVMMEGPDIQVPAPHVQPLALVVHEMIANAAQHGAFSRAGGNLSISWAPTARGGFHLRWTEQGVERPPTEARPGFGTIMVKAVVEKQLGGSLRKQWADQELILELEVASLGE